MGPFWAWHSPSVGLTRTRAALPSCHISHGFNLVDRQTDHQMTGNVRYGCCMFNKPRRHGKKCIQGRECPDTSVGSGYAPGPLTSPTSSLQSNALFQGIWSKCTVVNLSRASILRRSSLPRSRSSARAAKNLSNPTSRLLISRRRAKDALNVGEVDFLAATLKHPQPHLQHTQSIESVTKQANSKSVWDER